MPLDFKSYRTSIFVQIQAILCGWLLLVSFMIPHRDLERFMPELWKPVFPFSYLSYSDSWMLIAVWAWRAVLLACLVFPRRPLLLGMACAFSFLCLGLQNCFGLEIQLFASLQLAMIFLFMLSFVPDSDREMAFAVKLICVGLFFSAGLAKLRLSGWDWAFASSVHEYFRIIQQVHRNVLGTEWVLSARAAYLENETLFRMGTVLSHMFELLSPLALFSRRASRALLLGAFAFVFSVFFFMGIRFFTLLPLLVIWGIWDVRAQDLFSIRVSRAVALAFAGFVFLQLMVTLFITKNQWPVMVNDMYARPIDRTLFADAGAEGKRPLRDFQIEIVRSDGSVEGMNSGRDYSPLTRFHIMIALLKAREEPARNALLEKTLQNFMRNTCVERCGNVIGLRAIKKSDVSTTILARTSNVL